MNKALASADRVYDRDVQAHSVLAMASQQSGQTGEARAALANAQETAGTKLPKLDSGDLGGSWHDDLIVHILLREAKRLIEASATVTNSPPGTKAPQRRSDGSVRQSE